MGINRAAEDFNADFLEFFDAVGEGDDFGGADKGPVERVKEEDDIPGQKRGGAGAGEREVDDKLTRSDMEDTTLPLGHLETNTQLLSEYSAQLSYLLSLVVAERDSLKIAIHHSLGGESRGCEMRRLRM